MAASKIDWGYYFRRVKTFDVDFIGEPLDIRLRDALKTAIIQSVKRGYSYGDALSVISSNPDQRITILVRKRKAVILIASASKESSKETGVSAEAAGLIAAIWSQAPNGTVLYW